jgi:hypothetical protein
VPRHLRRIRPKGSIFLLNSNLSDDFWTLSKVEIPINITVNPKKKKITKKEIERLKLK